MTTRVESIEIAAPRGKIRAIHQSAEQEAAAIVMVGGAGGGLNGPARVYPELARLAQRDGISSLRIDYRRPNDLENCVHDVIRGLEFLRGCGTERAVLIGWSFGGAVVISAGVESELVAGVATVASQTYGTDGV